MFQDRRRAERVSPSETKDAEMPAIPADAVVSLVYGYSDMPAR